MVFSASDQLVIGENSAGAQRRFRLTSEPTQQEVVMLCRKLKKNVLCPLSKLQPGEREKKRCDQQEKGF